MRIAYLGPAGTFSEEAARMAARLLDADVIPFASMPALVSAAETRLAECAILPIENSLEGAVSSTTDLLIHETELRIRAELVLPVRHFLLAAQGAELSDIRAVTSHPQALGQCRRFLDRCLPGVEQIAALSTAAAAEAVSHRTDGSLAAIGTLRAAELYGVHVLAQDIQDYRNNVTRFVVLAEQDSRPTGHDKTSLCFGVRANVPGALYQVLAVLAKANIQ
ncbi:MAG TPA: prephenate dehydratase, partial [Thermomicrobiaceae bacterium]|nr:prephenate dehydratase [Thermomicrobiaceae bacterium]